MKTNIWADLEDIANGAERLASFALTLETAVSEGGTDANAFVGAAHILTGLMFDHAKKLNELLSHTLGKGA